MKDIKAYNLTEIEGICKELGQPKFRTKQLINWLFVKGATSYNEMTNLPATFRTTLGERYPLSKTNVISKQVSVDGTRKYVIELFDGERVETVGIPSKQDQNHLTVCFSTQVGCGMACAFCATGREGLKRNLSSCEMVEQIRVVQDDFGRRVSNVVSMGQGEPFQNYDATLEAFRYMNSKDGFGIGARHMTLSTCGVIKGIDRLSEEPEQFTLAVSLHSAKQELRDQLMPRCANMPLPHLKSALIDYVSKTGRRPSLEYTMISESNDGDSDLEALIEFCDGLHCHINLIPLNDVEGSPFKPCSKKTMRHWVETLESHGNETTIRDSRGSDIDGACGQLKNKLN